MRLAGGELEEVVLSPEDAGLERASIDAAVGGDAIVNAARLRALFDGAGHPVERDMVLINAGALLLTAGLSEDLRMGVALARDGLNSGAAGALLDRYVAASHG